MTGSGFYSRPRATEVYELMRHRRRQLLAITRHVREHDELELELSQLDADISAGVQTLERLAEPELHAMDEALRERLRSGPSSVWESMPVERIMTTDVVTLLEEDPLFAAEMGNDLTGHRAFPVVDRGRVVGLVTHRELLRQLRSRADARQEFVRAVMTTDYARAAPTATVGAVARMLLGHHAPCVLITEDDATLVGIVTKDDVLGLFVGARDGR